MSSVLCILMSNVLNEFSVLVFTTFLCVSTLFYLEFSLYNNPSFCSLVPFVSSIDQQLGEHLHAFMLVLILDFVFSSFPAKHHLSDAFCIHFMPKDFVFTMHERL